MINEDLAELLGIHIGDGCISITKRYHMYYVGGDIKEEKEYHQKWVSKLLNNQVMKLLNKPLVKYKEYPSVGVYGVYIFDKDIVKFFTDLGVVSGSKKEQRIPLQILENDYLIKRFIRGLFDTDGNIYFDKNRTCKNPINNIPIIQLGTTSKELCEQVFNLLIKFKFHPRLKKPHKGKKDKNFVHTILIYRKADIIKYIEEIGFKNSKHITKWLLFKKQGYLQPKTTIKQRKKLLNNKV